MNRFALLLASTLLLPLLGCPSADDDDSGVDGPTGEAPVLTNVVVCEVNNSRNTCSAQGTLELAFDVTVTDVDGDLLNPQFFFLWNDELPWRDGFLEGDLGDGGGFRLTLACDAYALGVPITWTFSIRDAEGNESEPFEGSYTVAVDPPSFGDPGVCPAN
jgi:hypothetical protein